MKKYNFFVLLLVIMCLGCFVPTGVFAATSFVKESNVYNNIYINYSFSVKDDNGKNIEGLNFVLYDKTKTLMFESEYNNTTKEYFFVDRKEEYQTQWYLARYYNERVVLHNDFYQYVPYKKDLYDTLNWNDITLNVMDKYNLHGTRCEQHYYDSGTHCNYYDYIPMILEETNSGKQAIVFATMNLFAHITEPYWEDSINRYYVGISLVNTNSDDIMLKGFFGDRVDDNIQFMRNAMYDYSDELWEQLNSGPIASSEMQYDNSDNDLSSAKVIAFKKNGADANNNTNIVNTITNPKTFNNGVGILIISLLLIIGLSVFLIKKNKKKLRINS